MPVLKYRPNESSSWQTVGTTVDGYSKEETDALLANKADTSSVYTKTETDTLLQDKADTSSVYTKTEADTLLQNKANTADFQSHTTSKSNPHGVTATQTGAYTKGETDTLLQKKVDKDRAVNPNLLDNWYFGNPIDQRQGRIVKSNTTYYSDNTLATAAGTTSAYVTAYRYATGTANGVSYASFKLTDSDTDPTYYAAPENVVRGYTGSMHTIDRWAIYGYTSGAIALTHGGINISGSFDFGTVIEMSRMPDDSPITASFLFTDGFYSFTVANKYTFGAAQIDSGGAQCVWLPNWPTAEAGTGLFFVNGNSFPSINRTFIAAKLELGTQQTLAHQDENGKWALNEIPDYGEQLARCQRRFVRFKQINVSADTNNAITHAIMRIHTPVPMATIPSISNASGVFYSNGAYGPLSDFEVARASQNQVVVKGKLSNVTGSFVVHQPGTVYDMYCDLTCEL